MIFDRPIPACDAEMACEYCGGREDVGCYDGEFICQKCLERMNDERDNRDKIYA